MYPKRAMPDNNNSFSLLELAELTSTTYAGDPTYRITNIDTLESATSSDISFLANPRYTEMMKSSQAGIVCVDDTVSLDPERNYLISSDPSRTFQTIVEALYDKKDNYSGFTGIHPTAAIHESASIGENVTIGPFAVIDRKAMIGDNTVIGAMTCIGYKVVIGKDCLIYPSCVIRELSLLGDRVILQPGVVIGSCGFGFTTTKDGSHKKLEQLGIVIIEDDVEIGANTTIDRSRFKATKIGKGTKIDNLVQIAHNVEIGEGNLIAAQTGIAGSSKTGKNVMMGGQVGVLGHVEIADHAMIATRGGVSKSLTKKGGKYRGSPAIDIHEYHRQEVHVRKLKDYASTLKNLHAKVEALESQLKN